MSGSQLVQVKCGAPLVPLPDDSSLAVVFAKVSFAFAGTMAFTAWFLKRIGYSGWQRGGWVLALYGAMQFAQGLNWLTVLPQEAYGQCTAANRYATYLAFVLLNIQPLVTVWCARFPTPTKVREGGPTGPTSGVGCLRLAAEAGNVTSIGCNAAGPISS